MKTAFVFDGPSWFEHCKELEGNPTARVIHTVNQSCGAFRSLVAILRPDAHAGNKINRQNLLDRDDYQCQYCGKNLPPRNLIWIMLYRD